MSRLNNTQIKQKINQMDEEAEMLRSKILEGNNEIDSAQGEFKVIQKTVQAMVSRFQQAHFKPNIAQKMDYDENTEFHETNVDQYLAECEEYLS